jgi:hypothetical protein
MVMLLWRVAQAVAVTGWIVLASPAFAQMPVQDAQTCYAVAGRLSAGEAVGETERNEAHEACKRATSGTSSIMDKYHLQQADMVITSDKPEAK